MNPCRTSLLAIALLTYGCGSSSGTAPAEPATDASSSARVAGRATKGPLADASVALFEVDGRGNAVGDAVARTSTDDLGNWSITLPADHPPYLVTVTGGRFVDEADTTGETPRSIQLGDQDVLLSVLPAGETTVAVTLFTHALVEKSRRESSSNDFLGLLVQNQAQFRDTLGVDPLLTRSADPLAPSGSADEQRYALIAGGAAYALNAVAISRDLAAADYATIDLFARGLVDCRFDGRGVGGQTLYDFDSFGERDLDDEILRFRNNNFDAYQGLEIPTLAAVGCPATPGSEDTTAPAFTATAAPLLVGATSAAGIASTAASIGEALTAFTASDDRDASPRVEAL